MFLDFAKGRARWVPEFGWVIWNGNHWERDSSNQIHRIAAAVGERFRQMAVQYAEAGDDDNLVKYVLAFARQCESRKGIDAFLELSKHAVFERINAFDAHPLLVNCQNTTLDFERLEGDLPRFRDHNEGDMLTQIIPRDWNMGARCARWLRFVEEIFPDPDLREFIQRAVGYSLLGSTREQCFFVCYGTGANGKSTFLNTLLHVFGGDYAQQADPKSFMAGRPDSIRNDLAAMRAARFVSGIEIGDGARLDEALVKQATGGDPIRTRFLYCESFEYIPRFKLWLAVNHRPRISGTDHAIWRRVRLIPFVETIPEERRDRDLDATLRREAEGILNWAIEGAVKYRQTGLTSAAIVTAATAEYRAAEDLIGDFLGDCCRVESHAQVSKTDLYAAFTRWAEARGEKHWTDRRFNAAIKERGFDDYRTGGARYWVGLHLETMTGMTQ